MVKKFAVAILSLAALWLVAMLVIGAVYGGRIEGRTKARIGDPIGAAVTIGSTDLALIRGRFSLGDLAVTKEDGGHLSITVGAVDCDLAPLGVALFDSDCRTLAIRKMRISLSALGAFKLKNASTPVHAERVVIDDAVLELMPAAIAPSIGLAGGSGKVTITVEHAVAKDTLFKTPLSWMFALDELRAKLEMPGDITIALTYKAGKLSIAGGLFGHDPIEVPFAIPVANLADSPTQEIERIAKLVKETGEAIIAQRAQSLFKKLAP